MSLVSMRGRWKGPVAINAGEQAAILSVETMLEPEGEDTLQQFLSALCDEMVWVGLCVLAHNLLQ